MWGIACLQVQYRGSDGFGKEFLHAGDKQWAAAMQVVYYPTLSNLTLIHSLQYISCTALGQDLKRDISGTLISADVYSHCVINVLKNRMT